MNDPVSQSSHSIARRGVLLVLSSPSGAGKTTISRALMREDQNLAMSVSVTTRPRRSGEQDGVDYHFIDEKKFFEMRDANAFLESAKVFNYYYATPAAPIEKALAAGRDILFDIDWQGTQQLAQAKPNELASIFLLPPSMAALRQRLVDRGQDSQEVVEARMAKASDEISHWPEYQYVLINDDLQRSMDTVRAILTAERSRLHRQSGIAAFVNKLRA